MAWQDAASPMATPVAYIMVDKSITATVASAKPKTPMDDAAAEDSMLPPASFSCVSATAAALLATNVSQTVALKEEHVLVSQH